MVFERQGTWYADVYVYDADGKRRRRKKTTNVKVSGEPGTKAYKESEQRAKEVASQIQRFAQLQASGLTRAPVPKKRLEVALIELVEAKERSGRRQATIDIVLQKSRHLFRFFGPDRDTATIGTEEVAEYAAWALHAGRVASTVHREVRHLVEAIALDHPRPEMPDLGKIENAVERFLEPEQFDKILLSLDQICRLSGRDSLVARADWIVVHVYMGLTNGRMSKILTEDIDLECKWVSVQYAGTLKHIVNIPEECREIFRRRRERKRVFPPWTSMSKRIKELCRACRVTCPTPENLHLLLEAWNARAVRAQTSSKRDHAVMYVHLGLTFSELYRIRRLDIDWEGNQVYVRGTKTDARPRALPMTPDVRRILERRHTMEPMFEFWSEPNMYRDLRKACRMAGITPEKDGFSTVSANDLRRTFATWLARKGVPILHLVKLMGHSSTRMLERVYARVERGEHMHRAIALIPESGKPADEP